MKIGVATVLLGGLSAFAASRFKGQESDDTCPESLR